MESPPDCEMEIIDNYDAIRLMINIYLIKKVKIRSKPVNLERFLDAVRKELRNRNIEYSRKRLLYTWKYLLYNYQFYKEKFTDEEARKAWNYFDLMNNCFDNSKRPTSEKFADPKWTFLLIESLNKHKQVVLQYGLKMEVLQAVEDDFRKAKNVDINQKDIHNQWMVLKRFYRQNQKTEYYRQFSKNHAYFTALKSFFEPEVASSTAEVNSEINTSETELVSAIESIMRDVKKKKQKTDLKELPIESVVLENVPVDTNIQFTIVMHDILLQCIKRHKTKIQSLQGSLDEDILNEVYAEFHQLGYNVTHQSISNEWNDLSYRYELIKNSEHPEKWPYYSDMSYIYKAEDVVEANEVDDQDNQSTIGSIIIENLRKNQSLKRDDYTVLTERLLNVYESNSKEFLEIKDILVERNLLRQETNYLLDSFFEKFNNKHSNASN